MTRENIPYFIPYYFTFIKISLSLYSNNTLFSK
uniref:Uncharacterized protein n=1 Tax=Myoviridae sp. ct4QN2 TaxID=2825030 RepID=A0A8S5PUG2_9CAUD|nr:MAG TPA: hypothetical protein [Myoviridae sp. ct4QN2]